LKKNIFIYFEKRSSLLHTYIAGVVATCKFRRCRIGPWDRFYKIQFRPKRFWTEFYRRITDGIFSYQNPNFGIFWKALEWKILNSFMAIRYTYFVVICFILWQFWYILRSFVIFYSFWYIVSRKIWQPCPNFIFGKLKIGVVRKLLGRNGFHRINSRASVSTVHIYFPLQDF
jgi:hypothetical protein